VYVHRPGAGRQGSTSDAFTRREVGIGRMQDAGIVTDELLRRRLRVVVQDAKAEPKALACVMPVEPALKLAPRFAARRCIGSAGTHVQHRRGRRLAIGDTHGLRHFPAKEPQLRYRLDPCQSVCWDSSIVLIGRPPLRGAALSCSAPSRCASRPSDVDRWRRNSTTSHEVAQVHARCVRGKMHE
jgi:hypothetical protein